MFATVPDLLRLLAVPVFGWAAYRDVATRRIPNRTWYPLVALAVVALAGDAWLALSNPLYGSVPFLVRVVLSVGILVPLAYGFWWLGGFGGADAKALMVLAALFPTYPIYYLPWTSLPAVQTTIGVFSLTILSNTVVVGLAYPLVLAFRNLLGGHVGLAMFVGRPIRAVDATDEYGRLLETDDGLSRNGLDLDALRMYLQWRGTSLTALRDDPDRLRDPSTLPEEPAAPGDGSIPVPDGGRVTDDDPWGAQRFLEDIDRSAYGTAPEQLRRGLDVLVSKDVVWLSPGIPFVVPMFVGLLVSLTYGDVLFAIISALGI
ncbi:MAG: prepilin peptidase [Haloarculaceae archaeon]